MAEQLTNGHTSSVLCLDVQRQTEQLASGGENGELCIWSLVDKSLQKKYVQLDCDCTSVCFSKINPNLLYAAFGEKILVFNTEQFAEPEHTYDYNTDEINQIILNNNEENLAACDDSGEVKIINLLEKKMFRTLRNKHTNICSTIIFRPNRQQDIVSAGLDGKLIHWLYPNHKCLNQFNMQELLNTPEDASAYMVNPPFIHHMACSPNGTYIACGMQNGQIAVFNGNRKNLSQLFNLHAHTQGVSQVTFCDETHLISGGNDCQLIVWDLSKAENLENLENGSSANGHGSPLDHRNAQITHLCKEQSFNHPMKINWLDYFCRNEIRYLLVADQTMCISVLPIS
ncbi:WD repeat-containing protein 53 isoform X2 [Patella vulgata]|nr:WD repeat-containing protein 53 isoform X2 [Patella vulgata]XP_050405191.1 WD repeat-containing protein 53 isoform X2 [Patella vulgata]XP_055959534.1 WD repeat-containing protein 53 isoform X2 [Patella vulgata]